MLVAKSDEIFTDLSTFTALTDLLTNGADSIRPVIGELEDGEDFVVYYIQYNGKLSKDVSNEFTVIVHSYSDYYDTSIAIADQVEAALGASTNFYTYQSATPKFAEQQIIYTEQIFNIKK